MLAGRFLRTTTWLGPIIFAILAIWMVAFHIETSCHVKAVQMPEKSRIVHTVKVMACLAKLPGCFWCSRFAQWTATLCFIRRFPSNQDYFALSEQNILVQKFGEKVPRCCASRHQSDTNVRLKALIRILAGQRNTRAGAATSTRWRGKGMLRYAWFVITIFLLASAI